MLWLLMSLAWSASPEAFEARWTLDHAISDDLAPVLAAQGAPRFVQRMAKKFSMVQSFDVEAETVRSTVETAMGTKTVVWTPDNVRRTTTQRGKSMDSAYRWEEGTLVAERWITRKDGRIAHVLEVRDINAEGILELTLTATVEGEAPTTVVQRFRPT